MTLGKVAVLAIIGIFAAFLFTCRFAKADECTSYDATLASIEAQGVAVYSIPPDKLQITVTDLEKITEDDYGTVTRGFMFESDTMLIVGFEVSGCLLDPVYLAKPQGKSV